MNRLKFIFSKKNLIKILKHIGRIRVKYPDKLKSARRAKFIESIKKHDDKSDN